MRIFSIKSVVQPFYKWGPWSCVFRRQGAVTAQLWIHICLCSSACIMATVHLAYCERRDEANFAVIDSSHPFLSEQDMDTASGDNTKKPSPLAGNLPRPPPPPRLEERVTLSHLTATFLCPYFTFRNARVGNLTVRWKYIVCNYHWENLTFTHMKSMKCYHWAAEIKFSIYIYMY